MSAYSFMSNVVQEECQKDNPRVVYGVKVKYKGGPVRAHTGVGDLIVEGEVYLGVGQLGEIDPISQDNNTAPNSLKLQLNGLDPTLVAEILNNRNIGAQAEVYLIALDDDERAAGATLLFLGEVSEQVYGFSVDSCTAQITCADKLVSWSRGATERFSDESHKARTLGDRFFRFVAQMAERAIYWGSKKDAPGFRIQ